MHLNASANNISVFKLVTAVGLLMGCSPHSNNCVRREKGWGFRAYSAGKKVK